MARQNEYSEEKQVKILRGKWIHFVEEGKMIPSTAISMIEKDKRFIEKPKAHWQYGIIFNRWNNIAVWFGTEERRNEYYDVLINVLQEEGAEIVQM